MSDLNLIVRTADRVRKAAITVPADLTGADLIQAAVDRWSLPKDTDYSLVNASKEKTVNHTDTLQNAGVGNGDILEVQPVLVAG